MVAIARRRRDTGGAWVGPSWTELMPVVHDPPLAAAIDDKHDPGAGYPRRGCWQEVTTLTLVFDGRCGVCTGTAHWVGRRDRGSRIELVPCQRSGAIAVLGVTPAECEREVVAVDASGTVFRGAGAVNRVFRELGGPWGALGRLLDVAPVAWVEAIGYRWFAANRHRFGFLGATPECDRPNSGCG